MAQGQYNDSNQKVVPQAKQALEQFKYEVANELGIQTPADGYWGTLTSRDCGAVGGHMVKKMIQQAEQTLMNKGGKL
ncbi:MULTISPECIES: alpha/beta-type small acid-soluble spore protein [Mahella]|uniref:Small acid-soluble spore protein alpha/beta type n=1 Tax=Mahella australiensis (strain DSM 15567 / CIP 107919 / 50-1 BON) TaxID=697281 RepID=F4A2L5_MAHA5|nr:MULTISPECIES: alpha/beta-type small acid-soluble spore protein [Mahella]MDI3508612.1 small acid-soluble spore protein [Clostridiales bacterium]AEE96195.1 small acid-soluble spore protein alpha/beta type [Mahella australiensis 50-1 BON]MBZ4666709.1 small acid-soluble spore protein alpha/beta type [Mahella sp.]MDK2903706.1 small acid-soluble spore protein [Clostridiales bacterium]MDK2990990.1 small acid-soluble spore protein [Clostridiales bacterium]